MQAKLLWGVALLGIDFMIKPSFNVFSVMIIMIALDFLTGIAKAKIKKVNRTSEGYRRTVIKLMQYLIPVLVLWVSGKFLPEHKEMLQQISGYVMMFIIYIEVTSVFENLYEIDNKSSIAKFLYKPALTILKFGIEKNPVTSAAEKMREEEKKTPDANG